jgi:hypothetical protein
MNLQKKLKRKYINTKMMKARLDTDTGTNPTFTNEVYTDAEHNYKMLDKLQTINHLEDMIKLKDERIQVLTDTIGILQARLITEALS